MSDFKLTYATMFDPPASLHQRFDDALARVRRQWGADHTMSIGGQPRNRIAALDAAGPSAVNVTIDCAESPIIARITRQSRDALQLNPGLEVYALVKAISVSPPAAAPR